MSRYVSYRDFDWVLMAFVLIICGMGVMELHSATMHTKFAGAIVDIPMLMVLAQPDLGTALTYVPIAVMGVFLGGLQWKQGLTVGLLAAVAIGAVFLVPRVHVLKSYQKQRLTSFIDPEMDPQGSGYQV